jgi:hypothetical protein
VCSLALGKTQIEPTTTTTAAAIIMITTTQKQRKEEKKLFAVRAEEARLLPSS